ncbi:SdiA-regulated domain-containing protein [Stutzerimonas sp. NM35]
MKPGFLRYSLAALAVCLLLLGVLAGQQFRLFERAWFNTVAWLQQDQRRERSLWLPDYRAEIQAKVVEGVADDLSALTFDRERRVLVSVTNQPPQLVELSLDGELLRTVELRGFSDPEAVEYIAPGLFVIADEREQRLVEVRLDNDAQVFDAAGAPQLSLGIGLNGNKGLEGLAYDPVSETLLVAKERDPVRIFAIRGFPHRQPEAALDVQLLESVERDARLFLRDLSSLDFDAASGHLLVLSDESRLLLELDRDGRPISSLSLLAGHHGLTRSVPQAEGVTLDDRGVLYLISEPNLFYRFVPR